MAQFDSSLLTRRVKEVYKINQEDVLTVMTVDPSTLLVSQRIDLFVKLLYIEAKVTGNGLEYAKQAYINHIHSITAFKDEENGQSEKNSVNAFVNTFDFLISEIKEKGFDATKSVIPISSDGIILDGAHRLACCAYFDIPVSVVKIPHVGLTKDIKPPIYDWRYFERYLLGQHYLDAAVRLYIRYAKKNVYMACIWPKAADPIKRRDAIGLIDKEYNIIYTKTFKPSFRQFDRLIAQIYMHDDWVGNIENGFSGSKGKSLLTFQKDADLTFVVFEGFGKEGIIRFKERVRNIFQIGKHSIHITDNLEQTAFLADIILNRNSLRFLEEGNPDKYKLLIRDIYNAYKGNGMLNLSAAKIIWGFSGKQSELFLLSNKEIKSPYTAAYISADPSAFFCYLGMKAMMPSLDVASKYLVSFDRNQLIKRNRNSIVGFYMKLLNELGVFRRIAMDRLFQFLSNHSSIHNLLRKIKHIFSK